MIMALHRRFQRWSTVYQGFSVVVTVCGRKNAADGVGGRGRRMPDIDDGDKLLDIEELAAKQGQGSWTVTDFSRLAIDATGLLCLP